MSAKPVITVSGIDGSGKSVFARRLCQSYRAEGLGALLLHVDDFRRRVDWNRADRPASVIYGEDYFDFEAIERCLEAFRKGSAAVPRPVFDTRSEDNSGEVEVQLAGIDVVVVEGVFMMRIPSTAEHFRVWLETPFATGKGRIIERGDPPWRSHEEWELRIEQRYFPAQVAYVAALAPQAVADVVIDSADWRAPRLLRADLRRLDPRLRPGLQSILPDQ